MHCLSLLLFSRLQCLTVLYLPQTSLIKMSTELVQNANNAYSTLVKGRKPRGSADDLYAFGLIHISLNLEMDELNILSRITGLEKWFDLLL